MNSAFLSSYLKLLPVSNIWHANGEVVARSSLTDTDLAEVTKVSHDVDAHSRGILSDTPNHSGGTTWRDVGEKGS